MLGLGAGGDKGQGAHTPEYRGPILIILDRPDPEITEIEDGRREPAVLSH